jgi:hypothetical protein
MNMLATIPSFDVRNAFRDPRSVHFQDDIRRAMLKGLGPVKEAPQAPEPKPPRDSEMRAHSQADNCRAILRHLTIGEDDRAGLFEVTGLPKRPLDRALRALRDKGHIVRSYRDRVVVYGITPAGTDTLNAPASIARNMAVPKKAPSDSKIDAVFALLSKVPASRAAIQHVLGMSRSAVDDCLRLLRVQDLIVWTQDPMTSIKTYAVRK